jgi:DNA gyrase/topoisomerase IV subunit A
MNQKSITNFLSNEYKGFAFYVIENRALPSVIDGFKPTQRKIIQVSSQIWKTGSEKALKVFQLGGKVASDAFYHHGSSSLENGIVTMAQKFKNNAPLLDEVGQYGSLRSPQAGAPRYIGTKLNNNFKLIYKDSDLLEFKEEEGESIEPHYFLPIIPMVLINGSSGIAVGFAMNILNRDIKSVTEACINTLKGKGITEIKPSINEFGGEFIQDTENNKRWIIRGKFQRVNTSTVRITELPPSMTYEKYEAILDKLCDDKVIVSYDNNCKDNIDYVIKFTRAELEKITDEKIIKIFKLEEYSTEIFSTLDEFGKLKIFENTSDIIRYFVNFRLEYYHKRKEFMLNKMRHDLKVLSNRGRFIKAILDEKLKVNNVSKPDIIKGIEEMNLELIDGNYDYLLRMPIYSLTKELFEKLKADFTAKKAEIKVLEETDPKDMYLLDLNELKNKFK